MTMTIEDSVRSALGVVPDAVAQLLTGVVAVSNERISVGGGSTAASALADSAAPCLDLLDTLSIAAWNYLDEGTAAWANNAHTLIESATQALRDEEPDTAATAQTAAATLMSALIRVAATAGAGAAAERIS